MAYAIAAVVSPTVASADLAADIAADLQHAASGVPVTSVTVGPPDATEALIGPGPNLQVTINEPAGTPLRQILVPTGAVPLFTSTIAKSVFWDMAVLQAAKHAVVRGNPIESISIVRRSPGLSTLTEPEAINAFPVYSPPPTPPTTMPRNEVDTRVTEALPAWAATGTVTVTDDFASERVVAARATLPAAAFRIIDPEALLTRLVAHQRELASQGARIGRVTVEVNDSATGDPLYAGAADAYLSSLVQWYSPLVWGTIGSLAPTAAIAENGSTLLP